MAAEEADAGLVQAGRARGKRGKEFSNSVADRLNGLGWQTELEVKITKPLGQRFNRDYGDVNVLAWKPMTDRVLIIECKDVQYRKTYEKIEEQLSDFRGELKLDGNPMTYCATSIAWTLSPIICRSGSST